MYTLQEILLDSPVIASVKDTESLENAIRCDCRVIFLLFGSIVNIADLVQQIHASGKLCIVYIDLIEGLSNQPMAVDGLVSLAHPDGLISTKSGHLHRSRQLGLITIQRSFILDSMSMSSMLSQLKVNKPDFLEILPGILPSIIEELATKTDVPLIVSGLLRTKQDVIRAICAGAVGISSSCPEIWRM